ncbi:MAG: CAP domain-containing protein [Aphanocapsa lilacina HA4352-LM1]|jgi:uncharacterized protein YkwD|nr:CAP domain-containing protein [Aphanocapsa lilacina HA4352-LM1]
MHLLSRNTLLWMAAALCACLALVGCQTLADLTTEAKAFVERVAPPSQPPAPGTEKSQTAALGQMEERIVRDINAIRGRGNLAPLKPNAKLAQVARSYSRLMAEQNFFSHTGPKGDSVADRVRSAGVFYLVVGENLAYVGGSKRPVEIAVRGWMKSPGHRENILRPVYMETGVGGWKKGNRIYFTQVFLTQVSIRNH